MIISPRRIFALCHVVMLSIKLALMSGYRLEGTIVLLVERRYVQKSLTIHIFLMIAFLFSGRDDWHRQFHILISCVKKPVSFFVISFHELKKKHVSFRHNIWPCVFEVLF